MAAEHIIIFSAMQSVTALPVIALLFSIAALAISVYALVLIMKREKQDTQSERAEPTHVNKRVEITDSREESRDRMQRTNPYAQAGNVVNENCNTQATQAPKAVTPPEYRQPQQQVYSARTFAQEERRTSIGNSTDDRLMKIINSTFLNNRLEGSELESALAELVRLGYSVKPLRQYSGISFYVTVGEKSEYYLIDEKYVVFTTFCGTRHIPQRDLLYGIVSNDTRKIVRIDSLMRVTKNDSSYSREAFGSVSF